MQLPVLIEPTDGDGFRAHAGEPFALTTEGKTQEDALKNLRELIRDRLARGATLASLQIPVSPHPLTRWAGTWKPGDPFIEEWKRAVDEYRQQVEENPDR